MSEMLKKMMQDARNWEAIEKADSHLKGYIFDSLVYRYMMARNAEAELERLTQRVSYEASVSRANRDKMRFMEILNEVIGEHD